MEKNMIRLKYDIIGTWGGFFKPQKTVQRTVKNDCNAYNTFEEEVRKQFSDYLVDFNHVGKLVILSDNNSFQ